MGLSILGPSLFLFPKSIIEPHPQEWFPLKGNTQIWITANTSIHCSSPVFLPIILFSIWKHNKESQFSCFLKVPFVSAGHKCFGCWHPFELYILPSNQFYKSRPKLHFPKRTKGLFGNLIVSPPSEKSHSLVLSKNQKKILPFPCGWGFDNKPEPPSPLLQHKKKYHKREDSVLREERLVLPLIPLSSSSPFFSRFPKGAQFFVVETSS